MAQKSLGGVTAYKYAVAAGYQGTELEFQSLMGNLATDLSNLENMQVEITTLPAGSSATAAYVDGTLSLGIPTGPTGTSAYTYARNGGYTGTEQQYQALMASLPQDVSTIENLSATATSVSPLSPATASYANGVISFEIPKGEKGDSGTAFAIVKIYGSYASMVAGYSDQDVLVGEYVLISSNVEDPYNSQIYKKGSSTWEFVNDMSGATGATGNTGPAGKTAYASAVDGGYVGTESKFYTDLAAVSTKQDVVQSTTATLSSSGWSNNTITVTVNGITATNNLLVMPAPASTRDWDNSFVLCTAQATNSLTFTCETTPVVDLVANILIM